MSASSVANPAETPNAGKQQQHLVFVYGTLKTGQPNHARLLEYMGTDISVVGKSLTRYPYPLVLATEYNVPFLINEICYTAKQVSGELFNVSSQALAFLDYIESAPTLYCRERIEVDLQVAVMDPAEQDAAAETDPAVSSDSVETRWCWCYFLAHHNPHLVAPPFFSEYDCAKTPLRLDIQSLTPQDEERIKGIIAREAQIMPM